MDAGGNKKVNGHRPIDVFLVARSVVDAMAAKASVAPPMSIRGVVSAVESLSGLKKVDLICHSWKSQQLYSGLFRYTEIAKIRYSAHINICWRRFAICKEAMHLLLDTEEQHFTTDVASLVEKLIVGEIHEPDHPLDSEWMGAIAALEVMLPWKLRASLKQMHDDGESDYQIAVQFRVPEKYVTAIIHGNLGLVSERFNRSLDESDKARIVSGVAS